MPLMGNLPQHRRTKVHKLFSDLCMTNKNLYFQSGNNLSGNAILQQMVGSKGACFWNTLRPALWHLLPFRNLVPTPLPQLSQLSAMFLSKLHFSCTALQAASIDFLRPESRGPNDLLRIATFPGQLNPT